MATPEQGESGRITLAVILRRLDEMDGKLDRIERNQCRADERLNDLDKKQAVTEEREKTYGGEIQKLRDRDTTTGILSAVFAAIAAGFGWLMKGP